MSNIFFILVFHCVTYLSSQNYDDHRLQKVVITKQDDKKEVLAILEKHKIGESRQRNKEVYQ